MTQAVALALVGLTSLGGLALGTLALGLRWSHLGPAIGKALECVGIMLLFFAANLTLGLFAILVVRSLTGTFVSVYAMSDVGLLIVSLLEGLLFHCWREHKDGDSAAGARDL